MLQPDNFLHWRFANIAIRKYHAEEKEEAALYSLGIFCILRLNHTEGEYR